MAIAYRKSIFFGYLLLIGMILSLVLAEVANAKAQNKDEVLIKLADSVKGLQNFRNLGMKNLGGGWYLVKRSLASQMEGVEVVQPNFKLGILHDFRAQDLQKRALLETLKRNRPGQMGLRPDNPPIPATPQTRPGPDPLYAKQWGMIDNGVREAWQKTQGRPEIIVAVLDTGVDYTHEDLIENLWWNKNEVPNNGIDDDKNGYVDDVIGYDFVTNDHLPYDLAVDNPLDLLTGGGNPGHGTHCAGNVAARGQNSIGVTGVAPNVKIMSLRFISEKGSGTTAAAIQAIRYAVDNGAQILSNSWGGEGKDDQSEENLALKEAIQYAQDKGALFIAAAGNGRKGVGYNNDTDALPIYPASYSFENIITVAAIDSSDKLGSFSNFGSKTVHIGAPGVKVFSTTVANQYSDTVIDKFGFKATWDGTSMATPHVAGAAALYWSANPNATYKDVKNAILKSAVKIPALTGKAVTEGKLNVKALMNQ